MYSDACMLRWFIQSQNRDGDLSLFTYRQYTCATADSFNEPLVKLLTFNTILVMSILLIQTARLTRTVS